MDWARIRRRFGTTAIINIVALIASILAGLFSLYDALDKISDWITVHIFKPTGSLNLLVSEALAEGANSSLPFGSMSARDLFPPLMVLGVFTILLACIYIVVFQDTTKATSDRAWDMIKIIAGFFIGNLTSLLK